MNKIKKTVIALFMVGIFLVSFVSIVEAQESIDVNNVSGQVNESPVQTKAVVVATVNIYNAQIVSQDKNKFKLSAEFTNREKVQPQIKYSISLTKKEGEQGLESVVDNKVYPDVFSLSENDSIKKEIDYQAPTYLSGNYNIWIISENENGLPLAQATFGEVTLEGDNQFLEITSPSCYLKVNGDDTKYFPMQGIDISSEESLLAYCEVTNNFTETKEFTYQFEIFRRSLFGEKVTNSNDEEMLSLMPGETKSFYFDLPADLPSQAYDAQLTTVDSQGETISNQVVFHYVIRGISGTIQNITLDKDYYIKGDMAQLSFFWTGSADNFSGSRVRNNENNEQVIVNGSIVDYQNNNCSEAFTENLIESGGVKQEIELPITNNCKNPKVSINLKDQSGNVLDEMTFQLTSAVQENKQINIEDGGIVIVEWLPFLFSVLIAIVVGFILIKHHKKKGSNVIGLLFVISLASVFFGGTEDARADTLVWYGLNGEPFVLNVSLNKAIYSPNELVTATAKLRIAGCHNGLMSGSLVTVAINNVSKPILDSWSFQTNVDLISSQSINAPGTAGNYNANFYFYAYQPLFWTNNGGETHPIPYTVVGPLISGACAATHYNCAAGTRGAIAEYATAYQWWCNGTGGGSNVLCTEWKPPPVVNGSCGTRNVTYLSTTTSWPGGSTLCNSGIASPASPTYPTAGSSVNWNCLGSGGGSTANCTATRQATPTLTLTASPSSVPYNNSSTLAWTTTNVASCWASGNWTGAKTSAGGNEIQYNITSNKTYNLECWNSIGVSSGIKSVNINSVCTPDNTCSTHPVAWSGVCDGDCSVVTVGVETGSCNNGCGGVGSTTRVCNLKCSVKDVGGYVETSQ